MRTLWLMSIFLLVASPAVVRGDPQTPGSNRPPDVPAPGARCPTGGCSGLSFCEESTGRCLPGCNRHSQCGDQGKCDLATHRCVKQASDDPCPGMCSALAAEGVIGCVPCSPPRRASSTPRNPAPSSTRQTRVAPTSGQREAVSIDPDAPYRCQVDEDCLITCTGAWSSKWYSANSRDLSACRDGCVGWHTGNRECLKGLCEMYEHGARVEGCTFRRPPWTDRSKADALLDELERRFGPVSPQVEKLVRAASPEQLDACLERVVDAERLDDVLLERQPPPQPLGPQDIKPHGYDAKHNL